MDLIKHIVRGCGDLPICGEHPGTIPLFIFTLAGFIAGIQRGGLTVGLIGVAIMLLFFAPMYLYGAYDRSVYEEKAQARKDNQLHE